MPCYSPHRAWRTNTINPDTGKRGITFSRSKALLDMEVIIPCGRCMGCRISKSVQWALRCVHESKFHHSNCFITLTYDDAHVPQGGTLVKKHFQDFMKRFRKSIAPKKVRYYMCGEYGEQLGRPHYHALIFGYDFPDKVPFKYRKDSILYVSEHLQNLWPFGFVTLGEVTYQTAAYCAKYATKKVFGDQASEHYGDRLPEYSTMSLKPGIGFSYWEKYQKEILQHDSVVRNGRVFPIPRFYTEKFTDDEQAMLKAARSEKLHMADQSLARLRVREAVKLSKLKMGKPL